MCYSSKIVFRWYLTGSSRARWAGDDGVSIYFLHLAVDSIKNTFCRLKFGSNIKEPTF